MQNSPDVAGRVAADLRAAEGGKGGSDEGWSKLRDGKETAKFVAGLVRYRESLTQVGWELGGWVGGWGAVVYQRDGLHHPQHHLSLFNQETDSHNSQGLCACPLHWQGLIAPLAQKPQKRHMCPKCKSLSVTVLASWLEASQSPERGPWSAGGWPPRWLSLVRDWFG